VGDSADVTLGVVYAPLVVLAVLFTIHCGFWVFFAWRDGTVSGFWTLSDKEFRYDTRLKLWLMTVGLVVFLAGFWWVTLYGFPPES
jgi:hypothetical protein